MAGDSTETETCSPMYDTTRGNVVSGRGVAGAMSSTPSTPSTTSALETLKSITLEDCWDENSHQDASAEKSAVNVSPRTPVSRSAVHSSSANEPALLRVLTGSSPRPDLRVQLLEIAARKALVNQRIVAAGDIVAVCAGKQGGEEFQFKVREMFPACASTSNKSERGTIRHGVVTRDTAIHFHFREDLIQALKQLMKLTSETSSRDKAHKKRERATPGSQGKRVSISPVTPTYRTKDLTKSALTSTIAIEALAAGQSAKKKYTRRNCGDNKMFFDKGEDASAYKALRDIIYLSLIARHEYLQRDIRPVQGVLLHGPPGTGKTTMVKDIIANGIYCDIASKSESIHVDKQDEKDFPGDLSDINLMIVSCPDIICDTVRESENRMVELVQTAKANAPCVLFLDEIDVIAGANGDDTGSSGSADAHATSESTMSTRLCHCLCTLLDDDGTTFDEDEKDESGHHAGNILIIGATNRLNMIHGSIRRQGRFDKEIEVPPPSPLSRLTLLKSLLFSQFKTQISEDDCKLVNDKCHGYTCADIVALVNESAMKVIRREVASRSEDIAKMKSIEDCSLTLSDLLSAQQSIIPSAMRSFHIEIPNTSFNEIGGNEIVKTKIAETVMWKAGGANTNALRQKLCSFGLAQPPNSVLLYGPPGCSKTMLARAVAYESKLNFISIKGSELISMYVGESEKAIRNAFHRARQVAPAVIFIDELDGLVGNRGKGATVNGNGGSNLGSRLLAQLLGELDGVKALTDVVVIGATNRPQALDAALLRPGRFDRLLYVPPPDIKARLSILKLHTKDMPLAKDVNLEQIVDEIFPIDGYTGADISGYVNGAAMLAMEEDVDNCTEVCMRHFLKAGASLKRSVNDDVISLYKRFEKSRL